MPLVAQYCIIFVIKKVLNPQAMILEIKMFYSTVKHLVERIYSEK